MPLLIIALGAVLLTASNLSALTIDPFIDYLLTTHESVWMTEAELHRLPNSNVTDPPVGRSRLTGGFSLFSTYSDYYRQGAIERPSASFGRRVLGKAFVSRKGMADWTLEVGTSASRTSMKLQQRLAQQIIHIDIEGAKLGIAGSVATSKLAVRAEADVTLKSDVNNYSNPAGFDIAGRLLAYRDGGVTFRWRRQSDLWRLSGDWQEENAAVELPLSYDTYGISLRTPKLRGFKAVASYSQSSLRSPDKMSPIPNFEPTGIVKNYRAAIEYGKEGHLFWVGSRGHVSRLQARGLEGGSSFAKITRFDTDVRTIFAGFDSELSKLASRSMKGELEYFQWDAASRGHIEFWPFTSGFIDLLGMRRYFITSSEGTLWRLYLAHFSRFKSEAGNDIFRWSFGTHLFDVRPKATLEHWRPEFLIFGQDDLQHSELPVRRILGCIPQLEISTTLIGLGVSYQFTQLIPVKTWRRSLPAASPAPTTRGASAPYGGGFHQLMISHNF